MKLKLTLRELLNIHQTLKTIIDDKHSNIDALFKFKLLGLMREISPHVSNFEIIRNEKIIQYGHKSKKGNYQISTEDKTAINKFNHDMEQVLSSDLTISIEKLKANDIFNKGVKAEYLIGLYPIISE